MNDNVCFNEKIEKLSMDEIESLQNEKLPRQLEYVFSRSPFYRKKLESAQLKPEDIKTVNDLVNFPFTTKDELRESQINYPPFGEHVACSEQDIVRVHASSGTTGRPSYIPVTKYDSDIWKETVARVYYSQGVRHNSRVVMGIGMGFFVGGLATHDAMALLGSMFIPIGTGASDRIIRAFQDIKADIIFCTPSYAIYLAEYIQKKMNIDPKELGVKMVMLGAEPGGGVPGIKRRIEEYWNAKVTESIGNADLLPVYGAECIERNGNHILCHDSLYLEVIDPDTGERIEMEDGASGELVATHIDRKSVPLIRFRTRDRVEVYDTPCSCGRKTPKLRIVGRTDDMLILLGVNVFPSAIKDIVSNFRPETNGEIQILLEKPGPKVDPPLKIKVEHGQNVGDMKGLKKAIEEELRSELIFFADVELVPPGSLPRYEMKAKLIKKLYEDE